MYCKLSAKSEAIASFCDRQQGGLEKHMYVIKALSKKLHCSEMSAGVFRTLPEQQKKIKKKTALQPSRVSLLGETYASVE